MTPFGVGLDPKEIPGLARPIVMREVERFAREAVPAIG
jgi:hypothetical protein